MKNKKLLKILILSITVFVVVLGLNGCKKVPLYAGEGSVIVISTDKTYLATGGAQAVISILGFNSDGTPLHDNLSVVFSATLGAVEPAQVELISGKASVVFRSGNTSGVAEIRARSGNINADPNPLKITIGSAAISVLSLSANPTSFDTGGGKSKIQARTFDSDGNPLSNIQVVLTSTSGTFEKALASYTTDSQGLVEDYLNVTETTKVKAEAGSKSSEIEIKVDDSDNVLPKAGFAFSPSPAKKGEAVHFNASLSTDSDGTIVDYRWDFGDGKTGSGKTLDHSFTWQGTATSKDFTVILTVTDNRGGVDVTSQKVTVQGEDTNKLPTAVISVSPESPKRDEPVHFNGSMSTDPDGEIVAWYWDFGDGKSGAGKTVSHTYTWTGDSAKSFIVVLTVSDDRDGTASATRTVKVDISENQLPVAQFSYSPTNPKKGDTVTFDATSSYDPDGSISSYTWNFGDGYTGTGSIVNHTFNWTDSVTSKAFSVILTIKDNRGGETSTLVTLTIPE